MSRAGRLPSFGHKDGRKGLDRDSARCHASDSQLGKVAATSYPGG